MSKGLPFDLAPPAPSAYHRLNSLTKATIGIATTVAVLALGGYLAPAALFAVAVVPGAVVAGLCARIARASVLATLPIAVAVGLVSTFGNLGDTIIFRLGPLEASLEGLDAAARVTVRLLVMAAALALYGFTTPSRALVADLERRGVSPRIAFTAAATLDAVPALARRTALVRDAQRARGLELDGGIGARLRGLVPLAGPVVLGTLHGVEARALALEARAFGRPGRRELLWAPGDTTWERVFRWAVLVALVLAVAGALAGAVPRLP